MFTRVLLAMDLTPKSEILLPCLYSLCPDTNTEIILAYVFDEEEDADPYSSSYKKVYSKLQGYANELMRNGYEAVSIEMPWGEVYLRQFDGRCIKRLAFTYGNRLKDFKGIMEHIHAVPVDHGDIAYQVEIFPGYQIQMILWEGDDEFPPSSQILFSDNFPVSFAAEDMAVMGDVIIGSLKTFLKCLS